MKSCRKMFSSVLICSILLSISITANAAVEQTNEGGDPITLSQLMKSDSFSSEVKAVIDSGSYDEISILGRS